MKQGYGGSVGESSIFLLKEPTICGSPGRKDVYFKHLFPNRHSYKFTLGTLRRFRTKMLRYIFVRWWRAFLAMELDGTVGRMLTQAQFGRLEEFGLRFVEAR